MLFGICKAIASLFLPSYNNFTPETIGIRVIAAFSFILASAISFEYYLSYFIFKYFITVLEYSELKATCLTCIGLFLEIILLFLFVCYKRPTQTSSNRLISAFIKGFNSR